MFEMNPHSTPIRFDCSSASTTVAALWAIRLAIARSYAVETLELFEQE